MAPTTVVERETRRRLRLPGAVGREGNCIWYVGLRISKIEVWLTGNDQSWSSLWTSCMALYHRPPLKEVLRGQGPASAP